MCRLINAVKAAKFLREHDKYLILTHASPDGDTLGSGYALCEALIKIGKQAKVVCPEEAPGKFDYLKVMVDEFEHETVIAVDVADEKLLGNLCEQFSNKIDLCIDHHQSNLKFAKKLYLEGDSASACECVYNVINALGVEITPHIADCLYTGIATDTGCFKFSNTTARTHAIAAELFKKGANYSEINRVMFEVKSRQRVEMERLVLENIEFWFNGRCAIITVTQDMIKSTGCSGGDLDGITALSRQIEGVVIGITVREKADGKYKVSLRTFPPYDASQICKTFGGGGHANAAGCEFSCALDEVKEKLKAGIKDII